MAPHVERAVLGLIQAKLPTVGERGPNAVGHVRQAIVGTQLPHRAVQRMEKKPDVFQETKKTLSFGRGNVLGDIVKSKGESLRRAVGTGIAAGDRSLRYAVQEVVPEKLQPVVKEAVAAYIMRAGNCQEHAAIAFLLANRDFKGKTVVLMSYSKDHAFVLVGDGKELGDYVVVDVWDPSEDGKKYSNSGWYGSSEPRIVYECDGKDYIEMVRAVLGEKTLTKIYENAYNKAKEQTSGIEKVTKLEELQESYPFKIYDF